MYFTSVKIFYKINWYIIILNVEVPPKISYDDNEFITENNTNIINIPILEDQSIKLNCRSDGNPIPDMYWFKDNNYMGFYDSNVVTEEYGQVLLIKNVLKNHHGNYTCEARNAAGTDKKKFFLDVLGEYRRFIFFYVYI